MFVTKGLLGKNELVCNEVITINLRRSGSLFQATVKRRFFFATRIHFSI